MGFEIKFGSVCGSDDSCSVTSGDALGSADSVDGGSEAELSYQEYIQWPIRVVYAV